MLALLIYFVIAVILFSVAYYVVNSLLPDPTVRKFANIVLIVIAAVVVCWLLYSMIGGGGNVDLPRLRH